MDRLAFRVRGDTCNRVTKAIAEPKLHKNKNDGYEYDDARVFKKQVEREFKRQYYENFNDGMNGFFARTANTLNAILPIKVVSHALILKESKKAPADASTTSNVIGSEIKTNPDAQEEAS